jgi:hypothetical protein
MKHTQRSKEELLKKVKFRMYLVFYVLMFCFAGWAATDFVTAQKDFQLNMCLMQKDGTIYRIEKISSKRQVYLVTLLHKVRSDFEREGEKKTMTHNEILRLNMVENKCPN